MASSNAIVVIVFLISDFVTAVNVWF